MVKQTGKRSVGRPALRGTKKMRNAPLAVYMTEDQKDVFKQFTDRIAPPPGRKRVSTSEAAVDILLRAASGETEKTRPEIPVLGYVPGGPAKEVVYMRPGATVRPPFDLNPGCYALIVYGNSMENEFGTSIPDGSYAFFSPQTQPFFGAIVHAEWPKEKDGGEHLCTLKRFCPQSDGSVDFMPLNPSHKPITRREGEYVVRGVFVRPWEGEREEASEPLAGRKNS